MPLAAHAVWSGDTLRLEAAWGQVPQDNEGASPVLPLVRASAASRVTTPEQARTMGLQVANSLCLGGATRSQA